jgi:tRNA(Ile)-lysidine synthase
VRPLLDVPRADLRAYVAGGGFLFREDASNADLDIPRNRVRLELLPYLERAFSPQVSAILSREAAIARHDENRLHAEAIDLAASVVLTESSPHGERTTIDAAALTQLHPALAARVARFALERGAAANRAGTGSPGASRKRGEPAFIGFDDVERLLEFARDSRAGGALSLPGQQAVRRAGRIILGPEPPRGAPAGNSFRFPLSIPGEVCLEVQGWRISAEMLAAGAWSGDPGPARGGTVAIAAGNLSLPLTIRRRRPGVRFRPMGAGGRKKLQDFLVDRKVPRDTRDSVPLVVDGNDRIVWVVGESVAEEFRVTEPSRGVILLKARRLGGLG